MVMYASAAELASYLQQDLDTATANLALELASGMFAQAADTAFAPTTVTFSALGGAGSRLELPYRPVTAVSQVRLNGAVITGWSLARNVLYRSAGFGTSYAFPPDLVEVDLTYGYTTVPADVKKAVLETAAQAYENPLGVVQETVGANSTRFQLSSYAAKLAADYRGPVFA